MTKRQKLSQKIYQNPRDLTWEELLSFLKQKGYNELKTKGKTSGSRVKFVNDKKEIISLHKPHPNNIVKRYVIKLAIEKLEK